MASALFDWLTDSAIYDRGGLEIPDKLFRYVGSDGLGYTISTGEIRMNAWSQMNDPRESHRWRAEPGPGGAGSLTQEQIDKRVDTALRGASNILCLTRDRAPISDDAAQYLFHRGWARAALWSHYAAAHRGACLVLDTQALMDSVREIPPRELRYTSIGRVNYIDEPLSIDLPGPFENMNALDQAIENLLDQRGAIQRMHLTKNCDWAYESEVRVALVHPKVTSQDLDTAVHVPLGSSLKGVILGDAHVAPELTAAGIRGVLGEERSLEMFVIEWDAGVPRLSVL